MYRYFLTIKDSRIEINPLNTAKLKKVTEREKDQIFFRTKLNGAVVLTGSDFKLLLSVEQSDERCTEIGFEIEKNCSGVWGLDWKGYFSCSNVKWNLNMCTATVTPKPDDEYRQVLENYSKDFNILTGTTAVSTQVKLDLVADFEFIRVTAGQQPTEDPDTWALFLQANYWIDWEGLQGGTRFKQDLYFRLVRYADHVDGEKQDLSSQGWQVVEDDQVNGRAKYAKAPDLYNFKPYDWNFQNHWDNYPELIQVPCGAAYDASKYVLVTKGFNDGGTDCWNIREKVRTDRYMMVLWEFGRFNFNRNRKFNDVVRHLVTLTATPELLPANDMDLSRFFNAEVNYVTNRPNTLINMQVGALSDIIGYNSSEPATKAEWNLKKLLDSLRQMFRVFWDIHNGKLRLEHESFFQLQGIKDLTVYELHVKGTDAYEYETAKMPRYQKLKFQGANNDDFAKGEIEYGGVCVEKEAGQDSEDETVSDITTDIEYLLVSGGSTGQKGFVFLLVSEDGILSEIGDLTGQHLPNAGLSAANLVANYYTHNRVLENGVVNRKPRTFRSVKKTKKQVVLTVPICCEKVNPYAEFISTLGPNAELGGMDYNLPTGSVTFTLLHETTGKGPLNLGRQFDGSFDKSFR